MNKTIQILIIICGAALLGISWLIVLRAKTTEEKQLDLIMQARALIGDEVYILAVPLLEEAAGYDTAYTAVAEEELKKVYLALLENRGYARRYTTLLEKQMARRNATAEVFAEAADYQLSINAVQNALAILKHGIERTADVSLLEMYERSRYTFEMNRTVFDVISAIYNETVQVRIHGKWGIAGTDGVLLIPCEYDKVSTLYQNRAIVKKNGVISAVDRNNNRVALAQTEVLDFRNFSENRVALMSEIGWRRATGDFELGASVFEDIGMYSGGYAAAKIDGKWGVISIGNDWLISAQHDEIIQDELGRCYGQGAVFVRDSGLVYLYTNGIQKANVYQNARPFSDKGYAAVQQNEKWGFIDTDGNVMIDFMFDDALSFGGHLAAVKIGELWGYVSIYGNVVIDTIFIDAKSFSNGTAPVLTERGWQLITLVEYKKQKLL